MANVLPPLDYNSILMAAAFGVMLFRTGGAYRHARRVGAIRTGLFAAGRTIYRSADAAAFSRTLRQRSAILALLAVGTTWYGWLALVSVLRLVR